MSRFVDPVPQYFSEDGDVLSSGRMKFFVNRDYSTLKDTFSQSDNTVPNKNPLPLSGSGRMPPCFGEGLYSVKLYAYDPNEPDGLGTLIWTRDDVSISQLTGQFSSFNSITPYNLNDIVRASNGFYYKSIKTPNTGNDPLISPVFWSKILFISEYNVNETYNIGNTVSYNGFLYSAKVNSLIGVTPVSGANWNALTVPNSNGSFTPVALGTTVAGTASYTKQLGRYNIIDNRVFFDIEITYTGHTGTGGIRVSGLPQAGQTARLDVYSSGLVPGAGNIIQAYVSGTTIIFDLLVQSTGSAGAVVPIPTNLAALVISGSYQLP